MNEDCVTTFPFFSVIIPSYNNENDIERCVNSILAQTYTNFELILIDDGSTDSTPEICDKFSEMDKRVSVIHNEVNCGVVEARNCGLFRAIGKYIYYVDADDWIAEYLLEEAANILELPEPPDIFGFGFKMIIEDSKIISYPCFVEPGLYEKKRLKDEIYPRMMCLRKKKTWLPVVSGFLHDKIFSRDILLEHYCRDSALRIGEDSACVYECIYFAEKIYFSPQNMYFYNRLSESSITKGYHVNLFENDRQLAKYLRAHLGRINDPVLECQINKFEYRCFLKEVWQELQFKTSIYQSSLYLKDKLRQIKIFPICPIKGLGFLEKCFVILLSFRLTFIVLILAKILKECSDIRIQIRNMCKKMKKK